MKKEKGISQDAIGIKEPGEIDVGSIKCGNQKYHGGESPMEWSTKRQNNQAKFLDKYGK